MNRIIRIVFFAVLFVSVSACDSINASNNNNAVALIDLDAVAKALGRDEMIMQEISNTEQQLQEQLSAVVGELQNKVKLEQDTLTEKSTDEEKQRVQQFILQAQQRLRNEQAAAQQKSQQKKQELIGAFREEVKVVAEQVAKAKGVKIVKVISDDVLWFDTGSDITEEVIVRMKPAVSE